MFNSESKALTVGLWLALVVCVVMLATHYVRIVNAEDDCAMPTYAVKRTPLGLLCIGEEL